MKTGKKASTGIILEIRKLLKNGKYPVKLRITYKQNRRYYTLKDQKNNSMSMTKQVFAKVMGDKPRDPYKETTIHLMALEDKAIKVIEKLPVFTFNAFERLYFAKSIDELDLFSVLQNMAQSLKSEGRISTSLSVTNVLSSFKSFTKKESCPFENVDVQFLNNYEKWMVGEGNSLTTVGIYLRNVRTAFNKAIREGNILSSIYPFGQGKYEIPTGKNIKKALTIQDVGKIANYKVINGSSEHRYRDYWLFSYLCNGINIKDIARLTYGNIDGDTIIITRAKTERERKQSPRPITIVITKMISKIIDKWGNKPELSEQYIFPILAKDLTPTQEYKRIQQTTKLINEYISDIAKEVGITLHVTTYTARHSYATILKRSGASVVFISESLGHSNLKTTENYLADFEIDVKRQWAETLDKF